MSFMVKAKRRPNIHYSKNLYILLTKTNTVIGNAILKVTNSEYNHASISLDKECSQVYGFGRNTDKFESGFIKEDLLSGIYKNNEVQYKLLKFGVTDEEHRKVVNILKQFEINKEKYKFDKLGLALAALNIPYNRRDNFFCSGFIQYVLIKSGITLFDKNYALVKPNDFNIHPDIKPIETGKIKDLVKKNTKIIKKNMNYSLKAVNEEAMFNNDFKIIDSDEGIILTEGAGISPNKRKEIEKTIYDVFNIMDKSGENTKKYKERFSKMNNQQFDAWIKKFLKDDTANFYLEVVPFEHEPSLKDIEKAAKYLNVPLDEYVYIPFQAVDGEPIRTAEKVPVGLTM